MKKLLGMLIVVVLALTNSQCSRSVNEPPQGTQNTDLKPNIVLIMADDLGYGDLGCYGNAEISTPNIDALAAEGLKLTDYHSNGVVCSPTRAALLTGLYPQEAGIEGVVTAKSHRSVGMSLDHLTLSEYLKEKGYQTAIYGKWHLGYLAEYGPINQGFDFFAGFVSGNVDYFSHIDQEGYEDWWINQELKSEEGYLTKLITDKGVDFIRNHQDEPFFLYLPHGAPHYPYQGPEDQAERSIDGSFDVLGSRENKATAYKEMIESLDEGVGRIMRALEEENLLNNTLVIFCSDNGATVNVGSNEPFRGQKGQVYEGGHRVPAIFFWKNKIINSVSDQLVMSMDIFPTIVEILGEEKNQVKDFSGLSIDGLLFADSVQASDTQRMVFWRFKGRLAARKGPWKLILDGDMQSLYNLEKDPAESVNLIDEYPEKYRELKNSLEEWKANLSGEIVAA
jgi:arylsulfatase A-like enzyme